MIPKALTLCFRFMLRRLICGNLEERVVKDHLHVVSKFVTGHPVLGHDVPL